MRSSLLALSLALMLPGCGDPDTGQHDPGHTVTADTFDPGCGTFADPTLSTFSGCRPETVGQIARVGDDAYRCTETGFEFIDSRCRLYGNDLWCGCGVDDGDGPAT